MAELADIAQRFGRAYLARFGNAVLQSHRRALTDIAACRTGLCGYHRGLCLSCQKSHLHYHSCQNRGCPKCGQGRTETWIKKQNERLLPVPYFHIVFTLPDALRFIVRKHQQSLLPLIAIAAADTLKTLLRDPKWLGGSVGLLSVLHTWSSQLVYHPHVHCLVPGVGLTDDNRTIIADRAYLIPEAVLAQSFRGRFMALAKKALPNIDWPQSVWGNPWVVHCRPTLFDPDKVIDYLGRYIHRTAISNARILAVTDTGVTFRYLDRKTDQNKVITLAPFDFLSRFLQHLLPKGMHRVRSYGLLSPAHRHTMAAIKAQLDAQQFIAQSTGPSADVPADEPTVASTPSPPTGELSDAANKLLRQYGTTYRCPFCQKQTVVRTGVVQSRSRDPPWRS